MIREQKEREKAAEEEKRLYKPQINAASREIARRTGRGAVPVEKRLQNDADERKRRVDAERAYKEAEELRECTFRPEIAGFRGEILQSFEERQDALQKKKAAFEENLQRRRQRQAEDEVLYVQEHCAAFRAAPVPDYGIKLFNNDPGTRRQIGELLQTGDAEVENELKRVGGGDPIVGSLVVDSVDKFVRRMREGRALREESRLGTSGALE